MINNEDDIQELRRRLRGICDVYEIALEEIEDTLFLVSGSANSIVVSRYDAKDRKFGPIPEEFIRLIDDIKPDALILDPMVSLFPGADENNNAVMEEAMAILRSIASSRQLAMQVVHHSGKTYTNDPEQSAGSSHAARGASAIVAAARIMHTLTRMSKPNAEKLRLAPAQAARSVRYDDAKQNYSAYTHAGTWFELAPVSVGNGTYDPGSLKAERGDTVGVPAPVELENLPKVAETLGTKERSDREEIMRHLAEDFPESASIPFTDAVDRIMPVTQTSDSTVRRNLLKFFHPWAKEGPPPDEKIAAVTVDGETFEFWRTSEGAGNGARHSIVKRLKPGDGDTDGGRQS